MRASGLQAVDILYGMLQSRPTLENPNKLNAFNTLTRKRYFENYKNWSGTDAWAVDLKSLPAYLKPARSKAHGEFPKNYRLIGKTSDPAYRFKNLYGPGISADQDSEELLEIHTQTGVQSTWLSYLHAVEQLLDADGGPTGTWMYSETERALLYQIGARVEGFIIVNQLDRV